MQITNTSTKTVDYSVPDGICRRKLEPKTYHELAHNKEKITLFLDGDECDPERKQDEFTPLKNTDSFLVVDLADGKVGLQRVPMDVFTA